MFYVKMILLTNHSFIYNLDETGIQPEYWSLNVLAPVSCKPQAVTCPSLTTTTLTACANACGNYIQPYFVFKGKRFNPELIPGARGVMFDSGWSNAQLFKDNLECHFLPYVTR